MAYQFLAMQQEGRVLNVPGGDPLCILPLFPTNRVPIPARGGDHHDEGLPAGGRASVLHFAAQSGNVEDYCTVGQADAAVPHARRRVGAVRPDMGGDVRGPRGAADALAHALDVALGKGGPEVGHSLAGGHAWRGHATELVGALHGHAAELVAVIDADAARLKDAPAGAGYGTDYQPWLGKIDAAVAASLGGIGASVHKFCNDVRLLANLKEVEEPFETSQVGSSAMPFKRNPINAEKINSLARYLAALPRVAWDDAAHTLLERTLDDSANRRLILPDAFLAADELSGMGEKLLGMEDREALMDDVASKLMVLDEEEE